ncbi:hypothetical protein EAG_09757 [Camponotus floridanus]|uniref:Uncharacterized protein n=1 Tax=Camponotus floridanus TaxID=104421 RepID=E2ANP3_CAMFO|nr:hypothetical protein EAG_09757 [Camponotus floridanus]
MYPWYRDSVAAAAAAGLGGPVGVVGSGFCSTGPGQGATTIKTESGYSDCMLALDYVQSKDERVRFRRKGEALEVVAITADKQLEISPKEEFSGNGATGQKRAAARAKKINGKREETNGPRTYVAYRRSLGSSSSDWRLCTQVRVGGGGVVPTSYWLPDPTHTGSGDSEEERG